MVNQLVIDYYKHIRVDVDFEKWFLMILIGKQVDKFEKLQFYFIIIWI